MKKKVLLLALAGVLCVAAAQGVVVPQAGIKSVGVLDVDTTFTASTGVFSIYESGLLLVIEYDDGSPQSGILGVTFDLQTDYASGMRFEGGSFGIYDSGNLLLGGDVISVDFETGHSGSTLSGVGQALVTYSDLAGYPVGASDIVSLTFGLSPAFTGFDQDYVGESKVNLVVPEPATVALLGLGAVGLLRKRRP